MQFFKADIDDGVIYVTKNPQTWMKVSKEKAIEIESFLAASDPILIRSLKRISKTSKLARKEHLALYPVVKLTNRCNLTCPHCYIEAPSSMRRGKFDLEYREVKNFIDYIIDVGSTMNQPPRTLQLFGGEPTINKDFERILGYARERGLLVRVSSNAVDTRKFQSKAFSELYKDGGVEWRISLDSHVQEVHDHFRPRSFDQVVSNVRYMASKGAFISIKAVVGPHMTGSAARMKLLNKVTTRMITEKMVAAIEHDATLGIFLQSSPIARYLKLIYTRDAGILPRVQFHINHDGRVCPQDNLFEFPEYHFGDIVTGDYGFDKLCEYQALLEEPAVCEACPVSHYCPRADYADLVAGGLDSTKEFSVCSDIRDNVFYLMSLGQRGAALTRTILGQ